MWSRTSIAAVAVACLVPLATPVWASELTTCDEALTWTPVQASQADLTAAITRSRARLAAPSQTADQVGCALDAALAVGEALRLRDRRKEARELFLEVRKGADKAGPTFARQGVRALHGLGALALEESKAADGKSRFSESLKLAEGQLGQNDPLLVRGLAGLAILDMETQHLADAEQRLDRALSICHSATSPEYRDCVRALRAMGDLRLYQQRLSDARESYAEALAVADSHLDRFDVQRGLTLCALGHVATVSSEWQVSREYVGKARDVFSAINDDELVKWADEQLAHIAKSENGPTYEDRYVNGSYYRIGESDGTQVWVSAGKGSDLQLMVYVVNGSASRTTFYPDAITVDAVSERKGDVSTQRLKTYSADQYLSKVQNRNAWNMFAAAFAAGMANQPQPQTTRVSGNYYGSTYGSTNYSYSGNYYGTITQYPTAADYADSQARTRAQLDVTRSQLEAAQSEMSRNMARAQTVEPGGYYGGVVYAQKRGTQYVVTVPFAGQEFEYQFVFEK